MHRREDSQTSDETGQDVNACPWCGEEPESIEIDAADGEPGFIARVVCECGASGPWSEPHEYEEGAASHAANAWNQVAQ